MKYSLLKFKNNVSELIQTETSMAKVKESHEALIATVRKDNNFDWNVCYFLQTKSGECYTWKTEPGTEVKI